MGNEKNRSLIEWGKNVLIVLLALSALYLLGRTQLYVDGAASGGHLLSGLKSIFSEEEPVSPSQVLGDWSQGTLPRPVRMVVLTAQGSAGIQYDNTALDSLFLEFTNPLADALTGAGAPEQVSEEEFQAALSAQRPGIYLDLLGRVPLANLTAWLSGGRAVNTDLTQSVRRMLLTLDEDGRVMLYFIDENTGNCYVSETASDLAQRLERFVAGVSPNGASFAFQSGEAYASLAPYTLLGGGVPPQPDRFSVANPVPITDGEEDYGDAFEALVRSLSFQPQSMSYRSRDGVTIQEGSEKLRFSNSGQVTYEAAERSDPRFPLQGLSQNPTEWELVGSAWAFVERVFQTSSASSLCGDARLYVQGLEETEDGVAVLIGYQLDGAAVLVGQLGYAARIEISDGAITGFQLQLRKYTYLQQGPQVLPELQATAALEAQKAQGSELLLYYYDDLRGDEVTADWGAF
ncbi:hypothetical protein [Intestinimonas sp. HCP28S3_D6]|uniref:hypothetical protein n=1 Tax=Intestinimonas sp. HCP28S3_D6 TaxID=3438942 RepID=UPI003F89A563